MVFSHRQLNHPPLKSMVPSLSPHAVSISSSSQHNLSSSNKKAASSLHHSYHTRNNHGGKSRRQHALRLLCSHLFAFICAWQVGFLYSQLTIPCPSKRVKQRVGMDASHWKVRRPPSPPLPLPTGVRRAPAVASEDSRHHLSATTKNRTDLILGWSTVPYNEFVGTLDLGAPRQGIAHPSFLIPTAGSSQVLFLYPTLSSLPRHLPQPTGGGDNDPSASSLHNASNNCQVIKHIVSHLGTINERSGRTCLAIVGSNSNSYHLNKWMRQEDTLQQTPNNNNNQSKPMDAVSRYDFSLASNRFNGNLRFVPRYHITVHALEIANSFTRALDEAMSQLQPLADQVARAGDPSVQGTLVIMVCNFGHSELFANFVCAARANGVDVSKVLLFATDVETLQLGLSLNISTYYHEQLFSSIPNSAAELYGDDLYSKIMLSKAFASYLACETGYDFIFQDVDIIPYSPLYWAWWAAKGAGDYDLYFQEDFNGRAEYAPWIANSGCYFAKNNARTRYFFSSFLWHGDKILATASHQAALHTVLSEHASLYGLRIKTMQDDHEKIPIGWHYHRTFALMRHIIKTNKTEVYAFHMNWNVNKPTKQKFLEQMGDWYLRDDAGAGNNVGVHVNGGTAKGNAITTTTTTTTAAAAVAGVEAWCVAQPVPKCHYRDKPSVIPCRDSPAFENNAPSFW